MSDFKFVIQELKQMAHPQDVAAMAKFGIQGANMLGCKIPDLRKLAKAIGKNQTLALQLWASGIHEARILASMIAEPKEFTQTIFDQWISDFDSWDLVDQCCNNLFKHLNWIPAKVKTYSKASGEFQKRFAFSMIAVMAVHWKTENDAFFEPYFGMIKLAANDERNFVKKAVNWALRQIGKRNTVLRQQALQCCDELLLLNSKSANWIARDAMRELQ